MERYSPHAPTYPRMHDPDHSAEDRLPVVITGIGMITSLGGDRETAWQAIREGRSGVRRLEDAPGGLRIGATVDLYRENPRDLKVICLARQAAAEAIADSGLCLDQLDRNRFACAVSGHMGDTYWLERYLTTGTPPDDARWDQFLPNSGCWNLAHHFGLYGPRICHSTACASGLIDFLCAVRSIQTGQCDMALAGSAEAIHPLFAAGFQSMRVLADDDSPERACRPFDVSRSGFVMGEGAAMFVIERLDHAVARGAHIYAEVAAGRMLADAHHVTGLDMESDALSYLISDTLRRAHLTPQNISYINAHGTATQQNDLLEIRGIRRALGTHAQDVCVSSTKAMLGHLVNAAGSVELAITALALRDGFAPPTLNLNSPDPECDLDCVPLVGRGRPLEHGLKLSLAFGGHLVAVLLRRWGHAAAQPILVEPAAAERPIRRAA
ncbi:MAG: beta-ketoacyl-[acyl-carrier-protein] synthase family protein [Pirellulales bacterium]